MMEQMSLEDAITFVSIAGRSDQGEELPRVMVTLTLDWQQVTNKGDMSKPMPVAGVMQKQGIPSSIRYAQPPGNKSKHLVSQHMRHIRATVRTHDVALTRKAHA